MTSFRTTIATIALMALALSVGCGAGPDDPITGTWSRDSCFGEASKPADIATCSTKLRLDADLSFRVIDVRQSLPATATYPRCTTTRVVKGLQYSTDGKGKLTLVGTSSSTMERTTCANDADNLSPTPDDKNSVAAGVMDYVIKDKTLSITSGSLSGDYVRESVVP